ncbi:hypothetical protein L7F22_064018 [Adiantum nelumboides]|nr:hypothetical protein [Adiantum nelumboides]
MASTSSPCMEPGTIVRLRELHPSDPSFRPSGSFRVMGRLLSYDIETGMAVICEEDGTSLQVATQHLRDLHLRTGSLFQFIGELTSPSHQEVVEENGGLATIEQTSFRAYLFTRLSLTLCTYVLLKIMSQQTQEGLTLLSFTSIPDPLPY